MVHQIGSEELRIFTWNCRIDKTDRCLRHIKTKARCRAEREFRIGHWHQLSICWQIAEYLVEHFAKILGVDRTNNADREAITSKVLAMEIDKIFAAD
ncbi:hypothetical protein D3C80_375690 [compost metagenome]